MSFCSEYWYSEKLYDDEIYTVLQPLAVIQCQLNNPSDTISNQEFFNLAMMSFFVMGLLFIVIAYRSCKPTQFDFYRLYIIYLFPTLLVPLFRLFGSAKPGFNRLMTYSVLFHNLAEMLIFSRLWYGTYNVSQCNIILTIFVVWSFGMMMVFCPLMYLLLFAMIVGGSIDFMLTFSFYYLWKSGFVKNGYYAFCAILLHLIQVWILFSGYTNASSKLIGLSLFFTIPIYFLFLMFAISNHSNCILYSSVTDVYIQTDHTDPDDTKDDDYDSEKMRLMDNNIHENKNLMHVLNRGLLSLKSNGKRALCILCTIGIICGILTALVFFFSPCYFPVEKLSC